MTHTCSIKCAIEVFQNWNSLIWYLLRSSNSNDMAGVQKNVKGKQMTPSVFVVVVRWCFLVLAAKRRLSEWNIFIKKKVKRKILSFSFFFPGGPVPSGPVFGEHKSHVRLQTILPLTAVMPCIMNLVDAREYKMFALDFVKKLYMLII